MKLYKEQSVIVDRGGHRYSRTLAADAFLKIVQRRRLELVAHCTNDDDERDSTENRRLPDIAEVRCRPRTSPRMELRASQPISALAPIIFEYTTNRWTIETKQQRVNSGLYWELGVDKEGGKTESRYSREEKSWRSKEKEDGSSKEDAREGFLDAKEEVARSGTVINESPKKQESRREDRAIEDTEERKDTREGEEKKKENKDIEREGREEEEEEGRPLAGGPHRCGARRGQSAAA